MNRCKGLKQGEMLPDLLQCDSGKKDFQTRDKAKKHKGRENYMAKIKLWITNLKVAGKLKAYRMIVLVMTIFLVLVALIATLVIRSSVREITEVWSPAVGYIQELETLTASYRIKQYQHLVESEAAAMASCEKRA